MTIKEALTTPSMVTGEDQDEYHRLHAPEERLQRDMGEGDGQGQHTEHDGVGEEVLGQKQGHDVQHHSQDLGPGVQPVEQGVPGEILPQGDVL